MILSLLLFDDGNAVDSGGNLGCADVCGEASDTDGETKLTKYNTVLPGYCDTVGEWQKSHNNLLSHYTKI